MTVTADALDLLAGDPPRYPHVPGDFHRHPETGAPYVAHPTEVRKDGTPKRVMYGRPSSFGSALDNPYNLVKWKERQLLIGASILEQDANDRALGGPIFDLDPDDRDALDGLAARCHDAAGSSLAADRGTHVHLLTERVDRGDNWFDLILAGEALGIPEALQNRIVQQWLDFRKRMGLTALAVEQTVVNDRWRLAGTLDRLDVADHDILTAYGIIDAHCPFVGDIKTTALHPGKDGQPNWWTKYPVQLAAYVDAVPYDTETDERSSYGCEFGYFEPNPHIALIYHYDLARALDGEPVDWQAIPVNVDAGREGGDLCRAAADFAKRRDLFAMPAPTSPDPLTSEGHSEASGVPGDRSTRSSGAAPSNGEPCSDTTSSATPPPEPSTSTTPPTSATTNSATSSTSTSSTTRSGQWPSNPSTQTPSVVVDRDRLRARIADLIDADAGYEKLLRAHWPESVPPLSKPGHTDDELAQILAAVRRVETEIGAAWHPDDGPPPHSRLAIERALKAWEGRDPGTAWFAASLIATFEQCRNADSTFEELVAQFSISQAERLYDAAASQ